MFLISRKSRKSLKSFINAMCSTRPILSPKVARATYWHIHTTRNLFHTRNNASHIAVLIEGICVSWSSFTFEKCKLRSLLMSGKMRADGQVNESVLETERIINFGYNGDDVIREPHLLAGRSDRHWLRTRRRPWVRPRRGSRDRPGPGTIGTCTRVSKTLLHL